MRAVEEIVDLAIAALKSQSDQSGSNVESVPSSGSGDEDNLLLDGHDADQFLGRVLLNN